MRSNNELKFNIIKSSVFSVGAPMVISEIIKRGHSLSTFDEKKLPSIASLINCDVLIDMSAITDENFYKNLSRVLEECHSRGGKIPLVIDPPEAVLMSLNKQLTHAAFPELVPESYPLTGKSNQNRIHKFANDEYVVIKPMQGWWGTGVERMLPAEAEFKHGNSKNLIVQKYLPTPRGVGRIVTINHLDDFEIAASYTRISDFWRTGTDVQYTCIDQPVTNELQNFAKEVSRKCGLYLNGIDYIYNDGKFVLLETNAVPAMKEPLDEFGINIPEKLISHIERNINSK